MNWLTTTDDEKLRETSIVCACISISFGMAVGYGFSQLGVVVGFAVAFAMLAAIAMYLGFGWLVVTEKKQ